MAGSGRPRVLVCDTLDERGLKAMADSGIDVVYEPKMDHEKLLNIIHDFDAIVVRGRTKVTRDIIDRGSKLKLIGRAGVGLDNIDVSYAREAGIAVISTPEASTNAVAELVIGLMLCIARSIPQADAGLKDGVWLKDQLMGCELSGKVLGVVGMGRIGTRVARLAKAFGMKILAYDVIQIDANVLKELEADVIALDELLRRSDYITLHVPLTDDTRNLIGERSIRLMKKDAVVINASRGGVIDEVALAKALEEGRIAAAGLDVFEEEPPISSPLVKRSNVVLTPHIGGQTREAQEASAVALAERLVQILRR